MFSNYFEGPPASDEMSEHDIAVFHEYCKDRGIDPEHEDSLEDWANHEVGRAEDAAEDRAWEIECGR